MGLEFADAGSSDDLRAAYIKSMIDARREAGDADRNRAREALRSAGRQNADAEEFARQALRSYARSLDWAEDTEYEDDAHRRMGQAGTWVRLTFGCLVHRDGESYAQTCPVAIAHNRLGMSVGGVARRFCSLCGEDVSECPHLRGRAYMVPGGTDDLGWCRVCLKESCDHSPEEEYRVGVVAIIKEMELEEVSIVHKPAHPEARFESIGISHEDLRVKLGDRFSPGIDVNCDRCLSLCDGLVKHGN